MSINAHLTSLTLVSLVRLYAIGAREMPGSCFELNHLQLYSARTLCTYRPTYMYILPMYCTYYATYYATYYSTYIHGNTCIILTRPSRPWSIRSHPQQPFLPCLSLIVL
ncbi:uncharacterized protein GGS25DRAFT_489651 [Hypoxylon fragiforme]|uniref:uncharacterized protein n=1 Tax=Hypoxylon fragiforme TaxID=63214 RepID=UPI0020C61721|nr:uncharacterized protein GGS25DRAFT_489651 [Hypoxylon fragiforme]KAI2608303.1 hypothetical protein GGS25DRAFT_489651 [Hypoxylon fragiforme]